MVVDNSTKVLGTLISIFIFVCIIYIALYAFKRGKLQVGVQTNQGYMTISQTQPVPQPVPVQPVQQPVYQAPAPVQQPVYQAPVQQPVQAPVQQPVYQAPVQQPVSQPFVTTPVTEPQRFEGAVLSDVDSAEYE